MRRCLVEVWNFVFLPLRMVVSPKMLHRLGLRSMKDERLHAVLPHCRGRLLDVGCGPDNELVRLYPGQGTGVDVFPWPGIDHVCDTRRMPFGNEEFDTVTIIAALNHIPDREAVLEECRRLLVPDGRLILTMIGPVVGYVRHRVIAWWDPDQREREHAPGELDGMTDAHVVRVLQHAGFELEFRRRFVCGLNRLCVARKPTAREEPASGTERLGHGGGQPQGVGESGPTPTHHTNPEPQEPTARVLDMAGAQDQGVEPSSPNAREQDLSPVPDRQQSDVLDRLYHLCGAVLIIVIATITALHWRLYPVFVDTYYHMAVIHGFQQAGGIVTHAFWEMAPGGRMHIYPPGLHALGYLLSCLGVTPRAFITFISWACYPACLLTTWLWLRRVAGPRSALFTVVLLCGPMTFLFNQAAHTSNAAVLVIAPLALWALAARKFLICGTLNFVAIAMHPMGFFLPPALVINALLGRKKVLAGLLAAAVPVVLFGPWMAHMWATKAVLPAKFTPGNWSLDVHGMNLGLPLVAFAMLGICSALVRRDGSLAILGAALSFAVIFPLGLGARFLMFNVHWPLACLAGLGLADLIERLERRAALRSAAQVAALCVAYAALTVYPALQMLPGPPGPPGPGPPGMEAPGPQTAGPPGARLTNSPGPKRDRRPELPPPRRSHWRVNIQLAVLPTLFDPETGIRPESPRGPRTMDMIHRSGAEEFFSAVRSHVADGDVVFMHQPPGAALVTGVTGKWTSNGILAGVKSAESPPEPQDCDFLATIRSAPRGPRPPMREDRVFRPKSPPDGRGPGGPLPPSRKPRRLRLKSSPSPSGPGERPAPWQPPRPVVVGGPPGFERVFENEFGSLWRNPNRPAHNREPGRAAVSLPLLLVIVITGLALVVLDLLPICGATACKVAAAVGAAVVAGCLLPLAGIALDEFSNPPTPPPGQHAELRPPPALGERIHQKYETVQNAVRSHFEHGIGPDYFWSPEDEERFHRLMERGRFQEADRLLQEALRMRGDTSDKEMRVGETSSADERRDELTN